MREVYDFLRADLRIRFQPPIASPYASAGFANLRGLASRGLETANVERPDPGYPEGNRSG